MSLIARFFVLLLVCSKSSGEALKSSTSSEVKYVDRIIDSFYAVNRFRHVCHRKIIYHFSVSL